MTHDQEEILAFDPENYPALLEFLPAYWHEDFGEEYGSAADAIAAFASDASGDQLRNAKDEWFALRQTLAGRPLHEMQRALGHLGAAWQPQSDEELQAVDKILNQAQQG